MRESDRLKVERLRDYKSKEFAKGQRFGELTILSHILKKNRNYWNCICSCGKKCCFTPGALKYLTSCGCLYDKNNLSNLRFGFLTILNKLDNTNKSKEFYNCKCDCGNECISLKYDLIYGTRFSCGCRNKLTKENKASWTGYGEISGYQFDQIKNGAIGRNLEFNLSIEYLWELFLKQNRKCALSDINLFFPIKNKDVKTKTASLDRIDSSKGYIEGNVQWIHKDINFMKQSYSQDYFIDLCKSIVLHAQKEK